MKNVSGCLGSSPYDFRVRRPCFQTMRQSMAKCPLKCSGDMNFLLLGWNFSHIATIGIIPQKIMVIPYTINMATGD